MFTILLTGATGMVGSILAPLLKGDRNRIIYMIRSTEKMNSVERFRKLFGDIQAGDEVIDADISLPIRANNIPSLNKFLGKIDKVVHCAASIKFDEKFADEIKKININGTELILDLAKKLNIPEVHYISTAYVAGDAVRFNENDFDIGQNHRNVYESSKMQAERLVRNNPFVKYSTYRLGIVVGKERDGYTPNFNGYYGFLKSLWMLRNKLISDWEKNPSVCEKNGFTFDGNKKLCLPIKIDYTPDSTINIIPIDWVAGVLAKLINIAASNTTFHLTHPNPPKIFWLLHESLPRIQYDDGCINRESSNKYILELQKYISNRIGRFQPYVRHEAQFGEINVRAFLKNLYVPPPEIDSNLIGKLINFALTKNFGMLNS